MAVSAAPQWTATADRMGEKVRRTQQPAGQRVLGGRVERVDRLAADAESRPHRLDVPRHGDLVEGDADVVGVDLA